MDRDGNLLINLTRGSVVCDHVIVADKARSRMRGLLGRDSLAAGEGLLLQPAPSIHTAFMRFTIDAVFVDGTLRVKKIVPDLRPWRIASAHGAKAVVELAAGQADRRRLAIGDQLGLVEVTDQLGAFISNPVSNGTIANGHGVNERPVEQTVGSNVILIGTDRRFRSVAAALLTRRGCAVTLAERTSDIGSLVSGTGADVVVLDAGASLTEAARAAAQLETREPPVGVVIVVDDAEESLSAMPVLPKWGSFEDLCGAIERTRRSVSRGYSNGSRG